MSLLTEGLGLVRVRAQGLRRSGAKLAASLATFAESNVVLVRGKEGWRATGAVLGENWFANMGESAPRHRAARISGLLIRLVPGETHDPHLFHIMKGFFQALSVLPSEAHDAAEALAALRILAVLGLDTADIPGEVSVFTPPVLDSIAAERSLYVARINRGIAASGL